MARKPFRHLGSRGSHESVVALLCIALLVPGEGVLLAQETKPAATPQASPMMTADQLDSLVAPIALYPDSLLAQTLAASTYPLEIIQLQQWLEKNPKLKDKALADAVAKQPWDPAVQAMPPLPYVVKRFADDIQWTTELGNAFLDQQSDVMDAVQRMRKKAKDKGALASNEQQKVETKVVEQKTVIIVESATPEVIYVPVYSPTVVYPPPVSRSRPSTTRPIPLARASLPSPRVSSSARPSGAARGAIAAGATTTSTSTTTSTGTRISTPATSAAATAAAATAGRTTRSIAAAPPTRARRRRASTAGRRGAARAPASRVAAVPAPGRWGGAPEQAVSPVQVRRDVAAEGAAGPVAAAEGGGASASQKGRGTGASGGASASPQGRGGGGSGGASAGGKQASLGGGSFPSSSGASASNRSSGAGGSKSSGGGFGGGGGSSSYSGSSARASSSRGASSAGGRSGGGRSGGGGRRR